jgi:hypothetical protein
MEHWLRIQVAGDGRGHFRAQREARDPPGIGNTLRFEISFDQTELPTTLAALDKVLAGSPSGETAMTERAAWRASSRLPATHSARYDAAAKQNN